MTTKNPLGIKSEINKQVSEHKKKNNSHCNPVDRCKSCGNLYNYNYSALGLCPNCEKKFNNYHRV